MNRKYLLAMGITLLFLGVTINPAIATIDSPIKPISSGNTLYVGGTGEGNYTKIQDAINDANDGDTVFVFNGTYYENILVNKSMNLIGENKETTIVDGNGTGNVVIIPKSSVNISGFTIRNGNDGINIRSNNCTIKDNIISLNVQGIYLERNSKNNIIGGNRITLNNHYGVIVHSFSYNNTIIGNTITSNNRCGIFIDFSENTTIITNTISSNTDAGIIENFGRASEISGNNISYNEDGIILYASQYGNYTNNNISNNKYGIYLEATLHSTIECNNIANNLIGLSMFNNGYILIRKNNFIKNNNNHTNYFLFFAIRYDSNYWDDWIGVKIKLPFFQKFPKIIWYRVSIRPKIDWHPASEPYDIL